MYPAKFDYHRASSFADAAAALAEAGDDGKALAGGQTLIPMLKLRLLRPQLLVDLGGIREAREIGADGDVIEIGALARHAEIARSDLGRRYPILRDCALGIADVQVRNMGTIGGSLAEADPSSCWPALLVALDGAVLCENPEGERAQSVRDLLADAYTPALDAGELITRVAIERESLEGHGAFVAFKRCAPAYPTASCALQVRYEGDVVASVRMGFGCMGLTSLPYDEADVLAAGSPVTDALVERIGEAASAAVEPVEDAKGTAAYKRSLVRGLVRHAFAIVEARRQGRPHEETHRYYG